MASKRQTQKTSLDIPFYRLGFIAKNGCAETVDKQKYPYFTLDDFYRF